MFFYLENVHFNVVHLKAIKKQKYLLAKCIVYLFKIFIICISTKHKILPNFVFNSFIMIKQACCTQYWERKKKDKKNCG